MAPRQRALLIALAANAAFLAIEVVGGFAFGSLALLADAIHMISDVIALAMAYWAARLALRPPTERHTFGFGRTEVLVALGNGVLLLVGAIVVVVEAVRRLSAPTTIDAAGVLIVGCLGLAVNLGSAFAVSRHAHGNINMRGALFHLLADALGSIAVIVAAVGIVLFGADWLDPVASIAISVLVIVGAVRLLRDATHVLLEAVPDDLETASVNQALASQTGVEAVHHLHVWTTGSEQTALSAHVVLQGPLSLHDAQIRSGELKQMLDDRFGIRHATIEVECHTCVDDEAHDHVR